MKDSANSVLVRRILTDLPANLVQQDASHAKILLLIARHVTRTMISICMVLLAQFNSLAPQKDALPVQQPQITA
jgi:hypothetical protein